MGTRKAGPSAELREPQTKSKLKQTTDHKKPQKFIQTKIVLTDNKILAEKAAIRDVVDFVDVVNVANVANVGKKNDQAENATKATVEK